MAFRVFELKMGDKILRGFIERRRPPAHRRPDWFGRSPTIAKATWVKSRKVWEIFWQRAGLQWHRYEPDPQVRALETFLDIVPRGDDACFSG